MNNELYLQQLRRQYIQLGQNYLESVKEGKPKSEIRYITLSIRSVLTEIKAVEEDLQRVFQFAG